MSVSSRFVCSACRYATRRVATPVASPNGFSSRAFGPANGASRAAFSTSTSRRKEKDDPTNTDPEFAFLDTKIPTESNAPAKEPPASTPDGITASANSNPAPTEAEPTSPAANAAAAIPWYLRHTQDEASHSSQAVQKAHIPDLPTNPPPILPALLEYLAITAGLDDLSLLDLRSLDPPPALGPKLIMLIATARSERHLHVSADRFARWLRREHGLKANAAGLLGRNELKIKLRRKAKRMRMLANVGGALPEGNIDDGIRTGWICCTLSRVEAHPDDTHMPGDDVKEFIGFRDVKPGVNIVVQMFTEEKRAETDLETLWGGVLRTKKREERNADEVLRGLEQDLEDLESEEREEKERNVRDAGEGAVAPEKPATPLHQFRRPKASAGDVFPGADEVPSAKQMRGQMRRLHTVGLGR
ncbi:ATPase synthesis protein 25 mitochondrial [Curvularia kusanoi]|uniref:ATPase synthesis protein 25 n=1 Tax=Curvularia kusanoi TaxID=90978 RepID=A0A9P4TH33_CURKU|nr:ATPase synthesis protein 25 mitochondrial [Curvularia kusanoi]